MHLHGYEVNKPTCNGALVKDALFGALGRIVHQIFDSINRHRFGHQPCGALGLIDGAIAAAFDIAEEAVGVYKGCVTPVIV